MPDIDDGLRAVVHRLEPDEQPPFAQLLGRHRRRRARTAAVGVGMLTAATVTAAVTVPGLLNKGGDKLAMTTPATSSAVSIQPSLAQTPVDTPTPTVTVPTVVEPTTPVATLPAPKAHKCPTHKAGDPIQMIDYVDLLKLGGRTYQRVAATPTSVARYLVPGGHVATIVCTLDGSGADASYQLQDGDSTFVPAGTHVESVPGFDPRLRLSVVVNGVRNLYDASDPGTTARTGADVFPGLQGRVVAISLVSEQDGTTELGRISDPSTVADMVDTLLATPYTASSDSVTIPDMFLRLVLDDGTSLSRQYESKTGELLPGLTLPASFRKAVNAAKH